jgi:class 3 adenylate cyclase
VTVLFADLAGSTALGERLDPEDVRALQGELYALVNDEVERFGGMSEKFVGDAVLAVFGIPQAHEDDAERAVRAALAVRDGFPAFAARVREGHGIEVGVRVGVNTGEVVAGREAAARGELMVSGDAVNVAARLQQRAATGQVLVGERTVAATRRAIAYRDDGRAPAKGKDAPLAAWEAVAAVAPPGQRGSDGLTAPLIGRDDELAVLGALTARVEREHTPQLITIFGPAGVGKSRLLDEFVAGLPGVRRLQGRCLPYGDGVTYWPLAEVAKGHAGILESDSGDVALEKLRAALAPLELGADPDSVLDAVGWTIGLQLPGSSALDSSEVAGRLRTAWTRYLAALGRERLTVLTVEDVHWASEPLLDLLEHLTDALDATAVLTMCTARPEFVETRPTWGGGARNATSVSLRPLHAAEAERLVRELLGAADLPAGVLAHVVEHAGGNPFYTEEIVHMLVERGAIAKVDGRWAVRDPHVELEIPDSVHGVIAARIDLLDAESRDALRRCSVMGRVFWPPAVGVPEEVIAGLGRGGLVSEQHASAIAGMREFAFKHALTHDVAYASLPRAERRALHRSVGEWVQRVAQGRDAETAELAAYHLEEAIALGEDDGAVRVRAFELLLQAGDSALARGATGPARAHFERAQELAVSPRELGMAELAAGRLLILAGRAPSDAIGRLNRAAEIATEIGDAHLRGRALAWSSRVYWLLGRQADAHLAASEAVEAMRGLPSSPELAWALARRSQLEMLASVPRAAESAREAIAVSRRVGEKSAEANARINLLTAEANEGVPPDAGEVREIIGLALQAGASEEAYRAVVNFLWSVHPFLPVDDLERTLADLCAPLEEVPPLELFGSYLELSRASILYLPTGRWAAADEIVGRHPSPEWSSGRIVCCEIAGGLAFRRGDLARAAPTVAELVETALPTGEPQRIVPAANVAGAFGAVTGDRVLLRRVTEAVHAIAHMRWVSTFSTVPLLRALSHAGETELLTDLVALLDDLAHSQEPRGHHQGSLDAGRGLLALHEGRPSEAIDGLGAAAAFERSLGRSYAAACVELELAGAFELAGEQQSAEDVRRIARVVLDPLGCVNAY